MAEEMFGTPIGHSRADQDMAKLAMTSAQVQHLAIQDMMAPIAAGAKEAQTRYLNARAGEKETDTRIQAAVAAMAAGEGGTGGKLTLDDLPGMYMKAGSPKDALRVFGQVTAANQRIASTTAQEARAELIAARTHATMAKNLSMAMGGVDSPETLQAALQRHEQTYGESTGLLGEGGVLAPQAAQDWEGTRYKINQMALDSGARATATYRQKRLDQIDRDINSKIKRRDFLADFEAQEELAKRKRAPLKDKAGATDIFDKNEGARLGADFVNTQVVVADPAQGRILGKQLAERARQFRSLNPAITPTEAMKQAFDKMQEDGSLTGLRMKPPGANESEKRPLPLTDDMVDPRTGKGIESKLKPGFWYTDGQSKMMWGGPGVGWKKEQTNSKGAKGKIRPAGAYVPPAVDIEDTSDESDTEDDELVMED